MTKSSQIALRMIALYLIKKLLPTGTSRFDITAADHPHRALFTSLMADASQDQTAWSDAIAAALITTIAEITAHIPDFADAALGQNDRIQKLTTNADLRGFVQEMTKLKDAEMRDLLRDLEPPAAAATDHISASPVVAADATPPTYAPLAIPKIDRSLLSTADRIVSQATNGAVRSVFQIIESLDNAQKILAKGGMHARKAVTPIPADGPLPSGTMRMLPAASVFATKIPPEHAHRFTFDIPVYTWDAPHPHVPTPNPNYAFDPVTLRQALWGIAKGLNTVLVGPTGCGKCFAPGTPVMLFNGDIKPVEQIKVGDLLMGPDSFPRRVKSLASGTEEMFRVTPTKGDAYTVNRSHILSLRMTPGTADSCGRYKDDQIVNMTIDEYLAETQTFRHCAKGWRVPVEFLPNPTPLPFDPYVLGVWLGDGNSVDLAFYTTDRPVYEAIATWAASVNLTITPDFSDHTQGRRVTRFRIATGRGFQPIRAAMNLYGLIGNKHIPHHFKTAGRADRLALLAGIIDTDGHLIDGNLGYDITLKNERLLDDVIFVARSLGFAAYKSAVEKTCTNNGKSATYYRCSINGPIETIPTKVPNKKAHPRRQKKNVLNVGISVESIGPGTYHGFELDGPDRLFLLGDFTVVHNTTMAEALAAHLGRPFFRIPVHGEMRKRDMIGGFKQVTTERGSETQWFDGLLTKAISMPSIIDMDEIDRADPDLQYVAHQAYERKGITILDDGGRFIAPHPDHAILATANTKGRDDGENAYGLRQEMSEATRDRFPLWIDCKYMPVDQELATILADCPGLPRDSAERSITYANLMRSAFISNRLSTTCSYRQLTAVANWIEGLNPRDPLERKAAEVEAIRTILINRVPLASDVSAAEEFGKQVYGDDWK